MPWRFLCLMWRISRWTDKGREQIIIRYRMRISQSDVWLKEECWTDILKSKQLLFAFMEAESLKILPYSVWQSSVILCHLDKKKKYYFTIFCWTTVYSILHRTELCCIRLQVQCKQNYGSSEFKVISYKRKWF